MSRTLRIIDDAARKERDPGARFQRRWSDEEKATLREHYRTLGAKGMIDLLPHRSVEGIVRMALRLRLGNHRWNDEEIVRLRRLYDTTTTADLARKFGKSENAIAKKVRELGLSMTTHRRGYEAINQAARRHGYAHATMLRIIMRAGLQGVRILVNRAESSTSIRGVHRHYETTAIDDAVARWESQETPGEAARRVGVPADVLRQWLADAGIERSARHGCEWRLDRDVFDRVVKDRVRSDNTVSASLRHGIDRCRVGLLLRKAGVRRCGRRWVVSPEKMDEICGSYLARRVSSRDAAE